MSCFPAAEPLANGLMMIHGNRMETLRELVVHWLKTHPLAPLETEVFLVQSNGMAQWLKMALAADEGIGIAAAMQLHLPSRFVWQLYRQVLGADAVPKESPFDKPLLRWRLLRLLPKLLDQEVFAPLQRFLADDNDLRKQDQLAEQLADLFDQYQMYRADWLAAWADGQDIVISANGGQNPLPTAQLWQPALWRAILHDLDEHERGSSRATLHDRVVETLKHTQPAHLPRRIVVFGISTLPKQMIEVLAALAQHCQILLCVQNPCQHFWGDIIEQKDLLRAELAKARHQRKPGLAALLDPALQHAQVNPLLAAWGKQGRDYIAMLYGYDQPQDYQGYFTSIDLFEDPLAEGTPNLLRDLQAGIFDLAPLPAPPKVIELDDRSVQFALAHSRQREVEVLHDHLLKRFADDPNLHYSDVIVMMPDVSQYAPHIEAVFGQLERDDSRYLPFTIADRPQRGHHVLVLALERLLDLEQARLSVSDLLDLLAVPAFRARFGIEEAQLPQLQNWIQQAGIRWGLNAQQRQSFDLPKDLEQNTWLFGLKRMLFGYAVGQGEMWQGIEPYEEIGGLEAHLVGALSRVINTLEHFWRIVTKPHRPKAWSEHIRALCQSVLLPQDEEEAVIVARLDEALSDWLSACEISNMQDTLPISVVREVCLAPFAMEGVSQRFLAGKINFCTLMPMRAIPFKQLCILGLNDEDYPRSRPAMDFDLLAAGGLEDGAGQPLPNQYRPGDRSRREDDRYLFLDALLAAREQLYISYIGHNARDNAERTPSVLLSQLMDHIKMGYVLADNTDLLAHLTTVHPLQPFSRAYFGQGENAKLFTYAREWFDAYQPQKTVVKEQVLAVWQPQAPIGLADLKALLRDPIKLFMTRRLGVWFDDEIERAEDLEPFALDGLANHRFRRDLMALLYRQQATVEHDLECDQLSDHQHLVQTQLARLAGRGQLPLGAFAELTCEKLATSTLQAFELSQYLMKEWQAVEDLEIYQQHGGLELEDWLTDLYQFGGSHCCIQTLPQTISHHDQLKNPLQAADLYLSHLAGCAGGLTLNSFLVGADQVFYFAPLPAKQARQQLTVLMNAYIEAMTAPLSVSPKAALAYLEAVDHANQASKPKAADDIQTKALAKAAERYDGGYVSGGERAESAYLQRQFAEFAEFDSARFIELAHTLYQGLRTMEQHHHDG